MNNAFNDLNEILNRVAESTGAHRTLSDSISHFSEISSGSVLKDAHSILEGLNASKTLTTGSLLQEQVKLLESVTADIQTTDISRLYARTISDLALTNKGFIELLPKITVTLSNLQTTSPGAYLSAQQATISLRTSLDSQARLLNLPKTLPNLFTGASSKLLSGNLLEALTRLTSSYRSAIESIPEARDAQATFIAKYSPVEYSSEIEALEKILVESEAEAEPEQLPSIDDELASFDDRLPNLITGARLSLRSDNPDKARHVTTSVRELFTHVLHHFAPDNDIKSWSSDPKHYHNSRPTRRARVLYICRRFSNGPLTKFVEADVNATLELVNSLSSGTHRIESTFSEAQLQAVICRMESLVLYLLKISQEPFE